MTINVRSGPDRSWSRWRFTPALHWVSLTSCSVGHKVILMRLYLPIGLLHSKLWAGFQQSRWSFFTRTPVISWLFSCLVWVFPTNNATKWSKKNIFLTCFSYEVWKFLGRQVKSHFHILWTAFTARNHNWPNWDCWGIRNGWSPCQDLLSQRPLVLQPTSMDTFTLWSEMGTEELIHLSPRLAVLFQDVTFEKLLLWGIPW